MKLPLQIFLALAIAALILDPLPIFAADRCTECHMQDNFRIQNKKLYDYYQKWLGNPHEKAGLSCSDCHGGNPKGESKSSAHAGILPSTHKDSPLNYKNVPKTCGSCHQEILENFIKSDHYTQLKKDGSGPNCVTCHQSLNIKVSYSPKFLESCRTCHSQKKKNHPEVLAKAEKVIHDLNVSNGYWNWASLHFSKKELQEASDLKDSIGKSWHRFSFGKITQNSETLVKKLKALFEKFKKNKIKTEEKTKDKTGSKPSDKKPKQESGDK